MLQKLTTVTKEDRCDLYEKALQATSQDRQVTHLAEEMAELMIEVSHLNRGRVTDTAHMVEEIADVLVMVEQIQYMFGVLTVDVKAALDLKLAKYKADVDKLPVPDVVS
jgi:NTP pyrophosphatase (non-canonical NTP hydrolase)